MPPHALMSTSSFSQEAGDNRFSQGVSRITGRFAGVVRAVGGTLLTATMLSGGSALAKDNAQQPVVQTVSIQNPYISACHDISEAELKQACTEAANGTVIILRNPTEVSDIARDIFLGTMGRTHGDSIPVEVRDTVGPTTIFVFDKNLQIQSSAFTNGSLVNALGVRYPEKVAALQAEL